MPRPHPIHGRAIRRRFLRILRVAAALAIVIAAVAVLMLARGRSELYIHRLIATALGVGLTVLIGAGLMILPFLGRGLDADAAATPHESNEP